MDFSWVGICFEWVKDLSAVYYLPDGVAKVLVVMVDPPLTSQHKNDKIVRFDTKGGIH